MLKPRYYVVPTREQWDKARRWDVAGVPVREIAERLRVTPQAVYNHRRQWLAAKETTP